MTNLEINVAISESCGWYKDRNWDINHLWSHPDVLGSAKEDELPDCANDLCEIHKAVKTLSQEHYDGFDGFTANLARVTHGDTAPIDGWKFRPMQEATSRQRSEAFLRAIGKWKE